jgi:hypothetical protein
MNVRFHERDLWARAVANPVSGSRRSVDIALPFERASRLNNRALSLPRMRPLRRNRVTASLMRAAAACSALLHGKRQGADRMGTDSQLTTGNCGRRIPSGFAICDLAIVTEHFCYRIGP